MFEQISLFDGNNEFKINKPIRLIELFGGIGSQAKALENLGANFEHYRLCEFDKYAVASYNAVHHTNFVTSDITKINAADLGIVDTDKYEYIMTYSFPCQDLSNAGLGKGMDKGSGTRSGLLWEVERLLNECKELPQVLLMENVPQVHGKKNIDNFIKWISFLETKGYKNYWKDLNAKNFGIPQNRDRCFMISVLGDYNYTFPKGVELKLHLKDLLETTVDEKFYLSDSMLEYITADNEKWTGNNDKALINKSIASTINTGEGSRRCDASNYIADGLPEDINIKLHQVGSLVGGKWDKVHDSNKRVYDDNGLAPTLTTCGGGHREPKILVNNSCKKGKTQSISIKECQSPIVFDEQNNTFHVDGICNTIVCDGSSPGHNPRIIEEMPKLVGGIGDKKSNGNTQWYQQNRIYDSNGVAMCHPANLPYGSYKYKVGYRIRKLTPKECWRLMGFSDVDFENAAALNSNAQLYKQAGNSIVVNVLMAIFSQML